QLVVQDAGAPFRVPVDRARTPGSSGRSGDSLLIQSPGNRLRRDAGNVFPEDAFDDGRLRRLDLPLARRDGATVQRLHHALAVTETACRLPILGAPAQSSMRLVGQVLQEPRVHRPLEADVKVRDVALGNGD